MNERMDYPEWLEISGTEAELRDGSGEYRRLHEEKHRPLEALTKDEAGSLIRIIALDHCMREITDRTVFVFGRKNAYRFMRSIGMG